jgi:hypothetical protein
MSAQRFQRKQNGKISTKTFPTNFPHTFEITVRRKISVKNDVDGRTGKSALNTNDSCKEQKKKKGKIKEIINGKLIVAIFPCS